MEEVLEFINCTNSQQLEELTKAIVARDKVLRQRRALAKVLYGN